jgi:dolichyl-phosphate beta-glucosyltransferase
VPCYNEAQRLPVESLKQFLSSSPHITFLFVNDGSRDETLSVLHSLKRDVGDQAVVLSLDINQGKAEAVRAGMCRGMELGFDYLGFWDADLATPLYEIEKFISIFESRPELDMVFGSRVRLLGRNIQRRAARHYLGRIFATVASMVLGLPVYDTQCGAKIFRCRPFLTALFEQRFLSRWIFDVEIIARYTVRTGSHKGEGIYEHPLSAWADVKGSRVKPLDFVVAFGDLVRIYWRYRRTH